VAADELQDKVAASQSKAQEGKNRERAAGIASLARRSAVAIRHKRNRHPREYGTLVRRALQIELHVDFAVRFNRQQPADLTAQASLHDEDLLANDHRSPVCKETL